MKTLLRSKEIIEKSHKEIAQMLSSGMSVGQIARAKRFNEVYLRLYIKQHADMQSMATANAKRRQCHQ